MISECLGIVDKLMIEKPMFVNDLDRALHKKFLDNMEDMIKINPKVTHRLKNKFDLIREQKVRLAVPLHDYSVIPIEHVKKMGVTEQEFNQIKMLMDLDKKIFDPNLYLDHQTSHYKYLVDLSKYRDQDITKEMK